MFYPRISISSESYSRGHANSSEHNFGRGLIVDGGERGSVIEWEFECRREGLYSLVSEYASLDFRPVTLKLNGSLVKEQALDKISGGWTLDAVKKFLECEVYLSKGRNVLEVSCADFIPHIKGFEFIRKNGTDPLRATLLSGLRSYFILNPYKNRSAGLLRKFISRVLSGGVRDAFKKCFEFIASKPGYSDILGIYTGFLSFRGPYLVQIDVTFGCNNNCIGCWCNSPLLAEKRMTETRKQLKIPYQRICGLLMELKSMGTREIYFSGGGEPFTHPDMFLILEKAKSLGFIVYINTNFTLLSKKDLLKLVETGLDHITVSVWAGTPGVYTMTHPNKTTDDFLNLKENLAYLNSIKKNTPYTKVYHVISSVNEQDFEKMFDFAADTGSDSVEYTLIDIIPGKTESLLLSREQAAELKSRALALWHRYDSDSVLQKKLTLFGYDDFLRRISDASLASGGFYDRGVIENLPCTIGWTFSRINADGEVNGCLKSHRLSLGNIHEQSFSEIWNGGKQAEFRRHTLNMKPGDWYLKKIGNDLSCDRGCIRTCDDIGRNMHMHQKILSVSFPVRQLIKFIAWMYKNGFLRKKNASLHNGSFLKGPLMAVIDPTNRCDSGCLPCFSYSPLLRESRPVKSWHLQELSEDALLRIIGELAGSGCERIRFSGGGDPLRHPYIAEAVKHANSLRIYTAVTTGLNRIQPGLISRLIDSGLNEASVSVMGATPETFKAAHPKLGENDFYRKAEALKELAAKKIKVMLCNVVYSANYNEMLRAAELAAELGLAGVYYTLISPLHPELGSLALRADEESEVLRQCSRLRNDFGEKLFIDGLERLEDRILNKSGKVPAEPCTAGFHFTRIMAGGDVVPCCNAAHHPVGNIYKNSFMEIWSGQAYCDFRLKAGSMDMNREYFRGFNCRYCDNTVHNRNYSS